jgi:hypothetical protein
MDFDGIEKIKEQVQQGQTLYNMVQQLQMQVAQLTANLTGQPVPAPQAPATGPGMQAGGIHQGAPQSAGNGLASGIMAAHTPMTSYGQRLAQRSSPNMNARSMAAAPV